MTPPIRSAAVIGLGLIGGSVARDLAGQGVRVRAYDSNAAELALAARDGVVEPVDAYQALEGCDLVVIAVPVDAALDVLRRAAPHLGRAALITDVGSTKARIVELADSLGLGDRFVGSHPMAGDHRSGWAASRAGLFEKAPVYLCPTASTSQAALEAADRWWRSVGACPVTMDAAEHDRRLAWTSHLPHMVAVALGLALEEGGVTRDDLGPGGRDMTRVAGSSVEMWTAIAMDNAPAIEEAVGAAERQLGVLRAAIASGDADAIARRFGDARTWFYRGTA